MNEERKDVQLKNQVKGLTTAAGLWTTACMGLAIGIGFYKGAILSLRLDQKRNHENVITDISKIEGIDFVEDI